MTKHASDPFDWMGESIKIIFVIQSAETEMLLMHRAIPMPFPNMQHCCVKPEFGEGCLVYKTAVHRLCANGPVSKQEVMP